MLDEQLRADSGWIVDHLEIEIRANPVWHLPWHPNSCATSTRSVQAYTSERPPPPNSICALDSRNSRICSWLKFSAFCMCTRIRPRPAYPVTSIFMLILHWKPVLFHAHLVLD